MLAVESAEGFQSKGSSAGGAPRFQRVSAALAGKQPQDPPWLIDLSITSTASTTHIGAPIHVTSKYEKRCIILVSTPVLS